jgi:hypothetical protein
MARLTRLNVSGLADELAGRIVEELDYVREGRVQTEVAAAFTHRLPNELAAARAAGAHEPPGRTLTPPPQYALLWRATLSAAGLFAQLGATVPTRGFHLAYSPGFRDSVPLAGRRRTGGTLRHAS